MKSQTENSWANEVYAITLVVSDTDVTKKFYQNTLSFSVVFEDENCVVFKIGRLLLNFLKITAADELISPAKVGSNASGSNMVLTVHVGNVDVKHNELKAKGIRFLTEPMDRPWGIRTANFMDPDGYIWEIATPIDTR
jgi:catechol 2,3-dioxygenase-like lactoylglutathione lyase family enzyme